MVVYNHVGSGGVEVGGEGIISISAVNCGVLYDDLLYFMNRLNQPDNDLDHANRYSRIVIILMVFYIESLSYLLFNEVKNHYNKEDSLDLVMKNDKQINQDKKGKCYPRPIRYYLFAYYIFCNQYLSIDILGIRDLFLIRNKIFAHPPGRSIISKTGFPEGKGLTEKGEPIHYNKFVHFPNILQNFSKEHARELYNEIKEFLMKYYSLIDKDLNSHWIASYFHLKNI
ncbi:MAG: hypothetical protein L6277_00460 [Desulfobacterales bacterium]|nr:hypothetical protein [Pseudomonadota bacterium]MCG2770546.1 hypothetical protein [Desulfobacterales bacterium]